MSYKPKKAAQLVAAFILKNGGKPLSYLKAVKLVYLADRESIKNFGYPILDEPRYSLPLGPVNSLTLDFIRGEVEPGENYEEWRKIITPPQNFAISLADNTLSCKKLGELSRADLDCVNAVWEQHGDKDPWNLVAWTHNLENIPEWDDPNGGALPIKFKDIVYALELPEPVAVIRRYEEMQEIGETIDELRA